MARVRSLIDLFTQLLDRKARRLAARSALLFVVVFVLRGALPLAAANQLRLILDALGAAIDAEARAALLSRLSWLVIGWGVLMWGASALGAWSTLLTEAYSRAIQRRVQEVVDERAVSLDLSWFEDSRFHDALYRAQHEAAVRIPALFNAVAAVAASVLSLAMVASLFLVVQPIGLLMFVLVPLPVTAWVLWHGRHEFHRQRDVSPIARQLHYLHHLLASRATAKEVRLLDLGGAFAARTAALWDQLAATSASIAWWRCRSDMLINGAVTVGVVVSALYFVRGAVAGIISVGSVVMYVQWLQRAEAAFRTAQTSVFGLINQGTSAQDLAAFLALESTMPDPDDPLPMPTSVRQEIAFHDVSFCYPESGRRALDGVTFSVPAGKSVALVGPNGSGKTTLVKLLCRLHDPTSGSVTWDGVDLRRFRAADVRRQVAAAFQDFQRYEFTVRENIWVGDTSRAPEDPAIAEAADRAGVSERIAALPKGYDTVLGKVRHGGEDLSAGEWQGVALARAFVRECPVIVLDEPTSALDAEAESRLFERFVEHARGRTAVFVSHRFSTVRDADWIIVLDAGRVVEQGTHDALMRRQGRYARMFELQVARYRLSSSA